MTNNDYIPYRIEVSESASWIIRPIQVSLITDLTERTSQAQSFYLDKGEAEQLVFLLIDHILEENRHG